MARYDEPGFTGQTPTGPFQSHDNGMTAPGGGPLGGGARRGGEQVGQAEIRNPFDSAQEPGGTVNVSTADTSVADGTSSASALYPSTEGLTDTGARGSSGLADHWTRKPGQQTAEGRIA
jgi:hypothetical protein